MNISSMNNKNIISNSQEIKELAQDVIRMSANEHPMLKDTYSRFVDAGIEYPSYTKMTLRQAEMNYYKKYAENMADDIFIKNNCKKKISEIREKIQELEKTTFGKILDRSIITDFPKTGIKRMAIISCLAEDFINRLPCSFGKKWKKLTYKCFKNIYRL